MSTPTPHNNDDFIANQLSFDQQAQAQAQMGEEDEGDVGDLMMTLSRAAEKEQKEERKRKRKERRADKERKKVEMALTQASTSAEGGQEDSNIDPSLLAMDATGGHHEDEGEAVAGPSNSAPEQDEEAEVEGEIEEPVRKKRKGRKSKPAAAAEEAAPAGPSKEQEAEAEAPEALVDAKEDEEENEFEHPRTDRKKHVESDDELQARFNRDGGAMDQYLADRWMTTQELKRLEDAGVLRYQKGNWTEEEQQAIRQQVEYLRKSHQLTESKMVDVIMSRSSKTVVIPRLWNEIASVLHGRPVRFVQKYVKRMYDTRARNEDGERKGKWTEEEDEILMNAFNSTGGSWVKVAESVDRPEEDCRARWRDVLRTDREKGKWSKEDIEALITAVKEANTALGKDELSKDPPWEVVTQKMQGKRSQMQCRKKWHVQLYPTLTAAPASPNPEGEGDGEEPSTPRKKKQKNLEGKLLPAAKSELADRIRELAPATISAIDWETLASTHFPEFTGTALSKEFKGMMGKTGAALSTPINEILDNIKKATIGKSKGSNYKAGESSGLKSPAVVPDDADD